MRGVLAALTLASSVAPAVELVRRDLVATFGTMPADFDYEFRSTSTTSGSDAFEAALALRLGARWSLQSPGAPGALVLGGDVRIGYAGYESYGEHRLVGLAPNIGYGYAFSERWMGSAEVFAEYGMAEMDLDSNPTFTAVSADGSYLGYGLRVGGAYALSRRWSLGAELGYEVISATMDADDGSEIDIDQAGVSAGLTVIYRWSFAPGRLE